MSYLTEDEVRDCYIASTSVAVTESQAAGENLAWIWERAFAEACIGSYMQKLKQAGFRLMSPNQYTTI